MVVVLVQQSQVMTVTIALFIGDPRSNMGDLILWIFSGRERDAAMNMISNQFFEILLEHSLHSSHIALSAPFFSVVVP